MPKQMAGDGSFPAELRRTKPYGYSIFQLDNMATLCQVLSTTENDLWHFTLPDGRGIRKAVAFMYPYLADKSNWPHKPDVKPGMAGRRGSRPAVRRVAFGEPKYLDLWQTLPADPTNEEVRRNIAITQPMLWLAKRLPAKPVAPHTCDFPAVLPAPTRAGNPHAAAAAHAAHQRPGYFRRAAGSSVSLSHSRDRRPADAILRRQSAGRFDAWMPPRATSPARFAKTAQYEVVLPREKFPGRRATRNSRSSSARPSRSRRRWAGTVGIITPGRITQDIVLQNAKAMADSGLINHGWSLRQH